ncbi:hypothetical protein [Streptomyces sp. NPDC048659]|uniref:hypothetical protein n=1 Tax=Streptomyces sp. NPDC048659 TaxID=3155489 RepID=UPI00342CE9DF
MTGTAGHKIAWAAAAATTASLLLTGPATAVATPAHTPTPTSATATATAPALVPSRPDAVLRPDVHGPGCGRRTPARRSPPT